MVSINYASREVNCKIVYYGPGLSGKTTNLQYVHAKVPKKTRGDLISLATDADRTLYFDFLPINIGSINGFATKFQLYTVPGQVFYNATRKLVLRGVDGVVFVADSQRSKKEENIESLNNLKENLVEYGYDISTLPIVLQYNKRDLPEVLTIAELEQDLNWNNLPFFEASAVKGTGVFDTLKLITKMVLNRARKGAESGEAPSQATAAPAASSQPEAASPLSTAAQPVPPQQIETPAPPQPVAGQPAAPQPRVAQPPEAPVSIPQQEQHSLAASATGTAVAEAPAAASTEPQRIEVNAEPEPDDQMHMPVRETAPQETNEPPKPQHKSLAEIESNLQPINETDGKAIEKPVEEKAQASPEDAVESASQFADAFEVPRVVGMQKSLRVKKKKKKFFLFRLFSRNNE